MGLYSESIREKERQNRNMERLADLSLAKNVRISEAADPMEDVQNAIRYIVECFGYTSERVYGCTSVEEILDCILDPLCMMYEEIDLTDESWKKGVHYILAFQENGEAVVLKPRMFGYGYYYPGSETEGYVRRVSQFQTKAYIIHRPLKAKKSAFRSCMGLMMHLVSSRDYVMLAGATGLTAMLGLCIPAINRWVLGDLLTQAAGAYRMLLFASVLYITVGMVNGCIRALKRSLLARIKFRISTQVQAAVMAKVLFLPQSFFRDSSAGKISKRISGSRLMAEKTVDIVLDMSLNVVFSLVYIPQMAVYAPNLSGPAILILLAKLIISMVSAVIASKNEAAGLEADMEAGNFLYSSIKGIQKVKGTGAERRVYAHWAERYRKVLMYRLIPPGFAKWKSAAMSFVTTLGTVLLLAAAVPADVSRADYIAFQAAYASVMVAITQLMDMMQSVFLLKPLMEQVRVLIDAETESSRTLEYVHRLNGSIELEHISFSYPGSERRCLDDISFKIRKGEKIAIVGESGCGKSTLLKILIGMESPSMGGVYYDGKPLEALHVRSLCKRIGTVFQFSKVMPGSIYSNIAFSSASVTMEDAWEAAEKACIADDIRRLPLGMDTEISQSCAGGFSGGQKQRILIARAFAGKPSVMFFDEATSALDNITQKHVLEHVYTSKATVIMVAHRLSTVTGCSRILMLENGRIAEQGTYEELMKLDGKFAALVRKQLAPESNS